MKEIVSLNELCVNNIPRKNIFSKFFSFILIIFPLVCNYDFIGISPTLIFCFIEFILAWFSVKNHKVVRIDVRIFIYIAYMLISAFIGISNSEQNSLYTLCMKCIMYILFFFVFYVFSWQVLDIEYTLDLYIRISLLVSIIVIIQFVFSISGYGFSLVLPGIHIAGDDKVLTDYIRMTQLSTHRFSSFFFEPAHQCEYVIPCLGILLFKKEKNKRLGNNLIIAILLTIGCFSTTSTIGILSSAIMWFFWVLIIIKQKKMNGLFYLFLIIPIVFCIFLVFLKFGNVRNNLLQRLAILDVRNKSVSEGFRRIRYGWLCYGDMDFFHKIFGAGYQNFGYYIARIGTGYKYYRTNDVNWISYTNGITGMLIGLGIVGAILNVRLYLWYLIKSKNVLIYSLLLSWSLVMFTANSFDDAPAIIPLVIAMSIFFQKNKPNYQIRIKC